MKESMVAVVVPILTLLLGALVGGVAKAIQDRYTVFQEARTIAAALRAELSALVEEFKDPGTIAMFDRTTAHLSTPSHIVQPDDFLEIPLVANPFQVFDAHCGKIGLLEEAVEAVVATYGHAKSIVADLRFLPDRHKRLPLTCKQLIEHHESLKNRFAKAAACGEVAIAKLREREARRFFSWSR